MSFSFDTETKLTAPNNAGSEQFWTVSISGSYAIVGAQKNEDQGLNTGTAYIFEKDLSGSWDSGTKISLADANLGNYYGISVAISDSIAIVGANAINNQQGCAFIYERVAKGNWGTGTKVVASDGAGFDQFGSKVGLSGSYAIIGASGNDDAGNLSGSAYIFERVSEGDWGIGTKLLASDAAAGDYFGIDVGISGTRAIVGAYNDDDAGTSSGSAYIFERVGEGDWGTGTKLVAPDASTNSLYGNSVGIDGSRCIVGAFYVGSGMGAAYIYMKGLQKEIGEVEQK